MNDYYQVEIDGHFSSYKFYNTFLPELHKYFNGPSSEQKILISFANIKKISPLVIPNLFNVGLILKDYFNNPVQLFIPWDKKILAYLRDINFFSINNDLEIFNIDERFTGDIPQDRSISDICGTIQIGSDLKKEEIYNCYISKYKTPIEKQLKDEKLVDRILYVMAELSHNGASHSKGICFVSFQLNQLNKFEFSVSDCGIGYRTSLLGKKERNFFKNFNQTETNPSNHFASILEAIYYRKKEYEKIYGVYSIFKDILPLDGVIRLHTHNTQAIFTKYNFSKYLYEDPDESLVKDIINSFILSSETASERKYNPVRIDSAKFKGVHIEIEIPLGL
ncbi:MAG: hypothetical protein OEL89_03915 [Candidatus Peregrinibacteria bacterium]|nr:hypothetical protein [Candidatus Peregrinibacteria bacterium]